MHHLKDHLVSSKCISNIKCNSNRCHHNLGSSTKGRVLHKAGWVVLHNSLVEACLLINNTAVSMGNPHLTNSSATDLVHHPTAASKVSHHPSSSTKANLPNSSTKAHLHNSSSRDLHNSSITSSSNSEDHHLVIIHNSSSNSSNLAVEEDLQFQQQMEA